MVRYTALGECPPPAFTHGCGCGPFKYKAEAREGKKRKKREWEEEGDICGRWGDLNRGQHVAARPVLTYGKVCVCVCLSGWLIYVVPF